ncbi:MAG: alanine racemase [Lachnospiraceae bacterium]|nr:alanine racemase [Lachnospiraceae bacterium]
MKHMRVYARVDLDAIINNIEQMKNRLLPDTRIAVVIKADGYGHGSLPIAMELSDIPYIWGFCVATCEEAMELRNHGVKKPILILGYSFAEDYDSLIKNNIRPTIFTYEMAKEYSEAAVRLNKDVKVHIKIDTGMGRIGFYPDEKSALTIGEIFKLPRLLPEGIFTHFARADETDLSATDVQFDRFEKMIGLCRDRGVEFEIHHCSNSAGILAYPKGNLDMVRAGITTYGLWPSDEVEHYMPLMPALSLYSHVVYVKDIEPGQAISYGGTFVAERPMRIATVPVGYADGYSRGLSGKGYVLIHDKKAPILGRVCMDQFMVDVTDIPDVKVRDEVVLIGCASGAADRDAPRITVEELGDISGRFNYEFVCDLGMRIPRLYYRNGDAKAEKTYSSIDSYI